MCHSQLPIWPALETVVEPNAGEPRIKQLYLAALDEPLVLQWNKGLIAGWTKANEGLAKIAKFTTCQDIIAYSLDSSNREFFENLADARGCNE